MAEKEDQKPDWIYLPPDTEETSLWLCLHDGELLSCRTSPEDGTVTLEFAVNHLREVGEDDLTFVVKLDSVTSVRAAAGFSLPEGAGWLEQSLSWPEFEKSLSTDPLQISDAGVATGNSETTLRLGGFLDGEKFDHIYCEVFLRGSSISASRSDGKDFGLEAFIELGRHYWKLL